MITRASLRSAALSSMIAFAAPAAPAPAANAEEANEIALETYVYAYPLLISELTRRVFVGRPGVAMNRLLHRRAYPDASFTDVVRPNADTLYSILWYDVSKEPLVITLPDAGGRYHLLQLLDLWSDVFAAPGSRTTGGQAVQFVLAGPGWQGSVPAGALLIRSPTAVGWGIGRTQTNGASDYPAVHKFQDQWTVAPLTQTGEPASAAKAPVDPSWDVKTPPVDQIEKMGAQDFFALFAELMKLNPPHANDYSMIHRMARIGIEPGKSFAAADAPAAVKQALDNAVAAGPKLIKAGLSASGVRRNGWRTSLTAIGSYGTDYRARAGVAYGGLGANPVEDAIYPSAATDGDGKPLSSDNRYLLHFTKEQLPPVRAFWSLAMYDQRQLFTANPINRFAIGDRDPLKFNADGSLDLYMQRESPGADKESNWLPAPKSGPFSMNLRLYWPRAEAVSGAWWPPPVKQLQ